MVVTQTNTNKNRSAAKFWGIAAKIIRVLTIPPLLVSALAVLLYIRVPEMFRGIGDLLALITALAIVPTLAYPIQPLIPKFRDRGRAGQRTLAFIMSVIGYVGGFLFALIADITPDLRTVFIVYFLSILVLVAFNRYSEHHASGHACGLMGPPLFAVYYLGLSWLLPCVILGVAVAWSSLYLKRHTARELILGAMCSALAFSLVVCIRLFL